MATVKLKDLANTAGFTWVHYDASAGWSNIVAQQRRASHPFAFPPRGSHLVARALADDLAFKLRKG